MYQISRMCARILKKTFPASFLSLVATGGFVEVSDDDWVKFSNVIRTLDCSFI
mgnify:CR=1 FL=1